MPSPFPGMDPYLEELSQWPGVHQRLITYMADAMQPRIRPRYHVLIGERVYIAEPPQSFYQDVTLPQYPAQRAPANSAVAVAEPDTPPSHAAAGVQRCGMGGSVVESEGPTINAYIGSRRASRHPFHHFRRHTCVD